MNNLNLQNLKNKKIAVLGLGDENISLTKYLVKNNIRPAILDRKSREELGEYYNQIKDLNLESHLGSNYLDSLEEYEVIFRTPGIPYLNPKIQTAKQRGVIITSQTKLFFTLCPCPIIGVTGTKGKGTTSTLIYEILKEGFQTSGLNSQVYLGGNIGNAPINFVDALNANDRVILELSSFQLQDLDESPQTAVVLDIKSDHLDYHRSRQEYIEAKTNIVKYQTAKDYAIINADYETTKSLSEKTKAQIYWFSRKAKVDVGVWVDENKTIRLKTSEQEYLIGDAQDLTLKGEHNWENICAAITAAFVNGVKIPTIQQNIKSFRGLEHRLEFVRTVNKISFYNDSFSTTPDTTIAAIKSFQEPIILLIGGSSKNADYQNLSEEISKSTVKKVISIGQTAKEIIELIKVSSIEKVSETKSMQEAIDIAISSAKPGDVVLLSPASASFDCYQNYKQRGEMYKKIISQIGETQ